MVFNSSGHTNMNRYSDLDSTSARTHVCIIVHKTVLKINQWYIKVTIYTLSYITNRNLTYRQGIRKFPISLTPFRSISEVFNSTCIMKIIRYVGENSSSFVTVRGVQQPLKDYHELKLETIYEKLRHTNILDEK